MEENIVVIKKPKTFDFDFDLPKEVDKKFEHEVEFIIKHNQYLAEHNQYLAKQEIKTRLNNYCSNISMETIFINMENSKTSEPHKFILNLS